MALAFAALPVFAESKADNDILLSNVDVSRQKTTFIITYDIKLGEDTRSCDVALMLSTDAGQTFSRVDKADLSGDFGRITSSGQKSIQYDFSRDKESLAGKQLSFKVDVVGKDVVRSRTFVSGQVAVYPHLSYGVMAGMVRKWGWYAKARTDFQFPGYSYTHTSSVDDFWGTGASKVSRLNVTAGAMVRAVNGIYPYLGLGYGRYGLFLQDYAGDWAKVNDYCAEGLSLDAGVVMTFGKISVSAGVSNTNFKYTEAEIGLGIMF